MKIMTLDNWIEKFKARFNERELRYMTTQKAKIYLQLKDSETGEIHLHKLEYQGEEVKQE